MIQALNIFTKLIADIPNCATDYLLTIIITIVFSFNSLYLVISNIFEENYVLIIFYLVYYFGRKTILYRSYSLFPPLSPLPSPPYDTAGKP